MLNLSLVFTENQDLMEFSPIMKVSFQRTKTGDFYTHHFKVVLAYVVISRQSIEIDHLKIIFRKNNYSQTSLIRALHHFLINCTHLKLLFRVYLKGMFMLSCHSWEVLRFKFKRNFKNCLLIN